MKAQIETMDQELLKKDRVVTDIVTATTKKSKGRQTAKKPKKKTKSSKSCDEEAPTCEYMVNVQVKHKTTKTKVQSLGLIPKSPLTRTSPKRTPKKRRKREPPKKRMRSSRRIFEDKDVGKEEYRILALSSNEYRIPSLARSTNVLGDQQFKFEVIASRSY